VSFAKDAATGVYTADIKDRRVARLHLSLRTKSQREAARRYAAVETAVRQDHPVVALLRRQRLNVEALTACYEAGRSFDTLLAGHRWPTLGEAVADYLLWLDDHPARSDKTARNARSTLDAAVGHFGADTRLDALSVDPDPASGEGGTTAWHRTLTADGRGDATVALYVQRLAALYRWVQRREDQRTRRSSDLPRVLSIPIDWELVPRSRSHRVRFLTPGEAARLLAATPARLRWPVAAGMLAGLRLNEILFLTHADVDRTLELLYVQRKSAPWLRGKTWYPKNRRERDVPLFAQLAPVLEAHAVAFAGERWLVPSLDARTPGRPMTDQTFARHFATIVRAAGLVSGRTAPEGVTVHTLRHTFASWLVMAKVDLLTVSRLLGHTSTKLVESTYAHLSPQHRAEAVAQLGTRFTLALPDAAEDTP
jgi:integrase